MRFIVEGRAPEVGDVMDLRKYLQEVGINSPVPVEKPPNPVPTVRLVRCESATTRLKGA